jgi:predicted peptidase
MGGYGIWQLAMSMPKFFAAIVPICGGGMYWNAARLVNVPVWAHHGEIDHVVKVEESVKMVEAVNKQGGNAKLTIYPDTDHNSWTPTFSNPEVFDWLLSKTNTNSKELKEAYVGQELFG